MTDSSNNPAPAPPERGAPLERGAWRSRLGFILAASGSAIGLGNIVFFSANAYKYGGGAFYVPYLVGLFLIGIPVMIVEFSLGAHTGKSFPASLRQVAGAKGEFVGWFALVNAFVISGFYIVILAWVLGMLVGSFGALWKASTALSPPWVMNELPNPHGFFFSMLSSYWPIFAVVFVWFLNVYLVRKGAKSIEAAVRFFVPTMWIFMLILVVRGFTLEGGTDGVAMLFTPNWKGMANPEVWQGAFSQIFFTLSLGFGIMTAYASYLPKDADHHRNAVTTSLLNCGFEYVAGLAIFSILFVFMVVPKASTLSMMFFVTPQGIGEFGDPLNIVFGILFFSLLFLAGISSSISLVEGFLSALVDKFHVNRKKVLPWFFVIGSLGSILFALPYVINPTLSDNGTLGLTLVDLIDHWAFGYGLILVGLAECILIGWIYGYDRIRGQMNATSLFKLGPWFTGLVAGVIPVVLIICLVFTILTGELGFTFGGDGEGWIQGPDPAEARGLYGFKYVGNFRDSAHQIFDSLPGIAFWGWVFFTVGVSLLFTRLRGKDQFSGKDQA